MNDVISQLKSRKSVRVFEDKLIEGNIKTEIINSALEAPTAGGMMLFSIIDITDAVIKNKLSVLCDNQPFIAKAPMVLIFLADFQRWYDTFIYADCNPRTPEVGDILLAYSDAVIAAQNTVVAAESLNIGSCYIGDIIEQCEDISELLNLPPYVIPAAMLVYGYPTEQQKNRIKPARYDKEYIVYENGYKRLSTQELKTMHENKEQMSGDTQSNIIDKLQAFCNRKYMSEFSREMSRSVKVYLNNFK